MLTKIFDKFFFSELNARPLWLLRIVLGLTFFTAFIFHLPYLEHFFLDNSINFYFRDIGQFALFGRTIISNLFFENNHNILFLFVYWTIIFSSLFFTLGFFTRLSGIILFVSVYIFVEIDFWTFWGWIHMAKMFLLYVLFVDTNQKPSIDNWLFKKNPNKTVKAWPLRLLQIHFCVIYLYPTIIRFFRPAWMDGEEVVRVLIFPFISRVGHLSDLFLDYLGIGVFLSFVVLYAELLIGIGVWFQKTRKFTLWVAFFLHIGLLVLSKIPWWQTTMIAAECAFLCMPLKSQLQSETL